MSASRGVPLCRARFLDFTHRRSPHDVTSEGDQICDLRSVRRGVRRRGGVLGTLQHGLLLRAGSSACWDTQAASHSRLDVALKKRKITLISLCRQRVAVALLGVVVAGSTRGLSTMASVTKVAQTDLFVSEPSPGMFGNAKNEGTNPAWTNQNWLKSRFHFSFAEYHNHRNGNFGVLRVMNDDLVQPARGFGEHPHRDMEIVTYIVEGSLTHKDSMGTAETLGSGSVQYMTAGSGVRHSEHNLEADAPLRFIQMWLVPRRRGLTPEYGSLASDGSSPPVNTWRWLVGDADSPVPAGSGEGPPIRIHTDANISVATVSGDDDGAPLELAKGRQAYFLAVDGALQLLPSAGCAVDTPTQLERHDAAELRGPLSLRVVATAAGATAQVLMVEMADDGRSRFK